MQGLGLETGAQRWSSYMKLNDKNEVVNEVSK